MAWLVEAEADVVSMEFRNQKAVALLSVEEMVRRDSGSRT